MTYEAVLKVDGKRAVLIAAHDKNTVVNEIFAYLASYLEEGDDFTIKIKQKKPTKG